MDASLAQLIRQNYIPAGTVFTNAQMQSLTSHFLATREILDPHFKGFKANFDWQTYLHVDVKNPALNDKIIHTLNQFAHTPEGQQLIRQAGAMESFRTYGTLTPTPQQRSHAKVNILDGDSGSFMLFNDSIWLNQKQFDTVQYLGTDKHYHDISVANLLYHELSHAADALCTKHNHTVLTHVKAKPLEMAMQPLNEIFSNLFGHHTDKHFSLAQVHALSVRVDSLQHQDLNPLTENPVIAATNRYVVPHYHEAPRVLDHEATRIKKLPVIDADHVHPQAPTAHALPKATPSKTR